VQKTTILLINHSLPSAQNLANTLRQNRDEALSKVDVSLAQNEHKNSELQEAVQNAARMQVGLFFWMLLTQCH
jgi:hypothetical protein